MGFVLVKGLVAEQDPEGLGRPENEKRDTGELDTPRVSVRGFGRVG